MKFMQEFTDEDRKQITDLSTHSYIKSMTKRQHIMLALATIMIFILAVNIMFSNTVFALIYAVLVGVCVVMILMMNNQKTRYSEYAQAQIEEKFSYSFTMELRENDFTFRDSTYKYEDIDYIIYYIGRFALILTDNVVITVKMTDVIREELDRIAARYSNITVDQQDILFSLNDYLKRAKKKKKQSM